MHNPTFRYIIGNSPKLPNCKVIPGTDQDSLNFEYLKVQLELMQEEQILIIHTDAPLSPMQLAKIEYALLNLSNPIKKD